MGMCSAAPAWLYATLWLRCSAQQLVSPDLLIGCSKILYNQTILDLYKLCFEDKHTSIEPHISDSLQLQKISSFNVISLCPTFIIWRVLGVP